MILARSPFIVTINQASQIETKIELFIWQNGTSEPVTPTVTLSKKIPSATQRSTSYNISPYLKGYIKNLEPSYIFGVTDENFNQFINVRYKTYYKTGATFTLENNSRNVAVNGYTSNLPIPNSLYPIVRRNNSPAVRYYGNDFNGRKTDYFNWGLIVDGTTSLSEFYVQYTDLDGNNMTEKLLTTGSEPVGTTLFLAIPYLDYDNPAYDNGSYTNVYKKIIATGQKLVTHTFKNIPICEPKYDPKYVSFINQLGGWSTLWCFKASSETFESKSKEYALYNSANKAESKQFNFEDTQKIKLNTGWVDEDYKYLIKELMLSETVLIDNFPVKVVTSSASLKTSVNDKVINYELEFEYTAKNLSTIQ